LYLPNLIYSSLFVFDLIFLKNIKIFIHIKINNHHIKYAKIAGANIIITQKIISIIEIFFITLFIN